MRRPVPLLKLLLTFISFTFTTAANGADISTLIQSLKSGAADQIEVTLETLADLGPDAADAVPALRGLLTHDNASIQAHAAFALGSIGKASMPAVEDLAKLITDEDAEVRRAALDALGEIKPGPKRAVPLLISALGSEDQAVVMRALHSLADVGEPVIPAMIEALGDERTEYWALLVVHEIGPPAKKTVPAILKLAGNPEEPELRMQAAAALGSIGDTTAVPTLIKMLDDSETGVQNNAIVALGRIGPSAVSAAPRLHENLDGHEDFKIAASSWALAKIYPNDEDVKREATLYLAKMLTDDQRDVRRLAARALLDLKAGPKITIPAFVAAIEDPREGVMDDALDAIAALGADAVPGLTKALEFESVRGRVADLLRRIGPDASPAVPGLIKAFEAEGRTEIRREILFAIAHIGPGAKDAVGIAIKGTDDEDEDTRYAAFFALGKMGPVAMDAVPHLKEHLESADWYYSASAAWALARIDEDDPEVVQKGIPLFLRALESDQPFVRHEACDSLCELGPLAKEALPALESAAQDKDPIVAEAAKAAIKLIVGEEPRLKNPK